MVSAHFFIFKRGKGGEVMTDRTALSQNTRIWDRSSKGVKMIILVKVKLKHIFKKGKNYCWPRPKLCLRCHGSHLWGHGYVASYFDGFNQPFYLKRYRCPACGCVIKLKPAGYLKRFQAPIDTIRSSIQCRLKKGCWLAAYSRSRQKHWFNALVRKVKAYFGDRWDRHLLTAFDLLIAGGQNPVSRAI